MKRTLTRKINFYACIGIIVLFGCIMAEAIINVEEYELPAIMAAQAAQQSQQQ